MFQGFCTEKTTSSINGRRARAGWPGARLQCSFEIGPDDVNEFACGLGAIGVRVPVQIGNMLADVVLDQLRRQAPDRAADRGDQVQDLATGRVSLQVSLDSLNLPFQAADASQEFDFMLSCMTHTVGGYPIF